MNRVDTSRTMRHAVGIATVAAMFVYGGWAHGQQRGNERRQAPPPRAAAPQQSRPQGRPEFRPPQGQTRMPQQGQGGQMQNMTPQPNNVPRVQPAYPTNGGQAGYPAGSYGRQQFNAPRPGNVGPAPQGHLEDWLNQHRNVPPQDQERMLRSDPNFRRLPQGDQQRLTQQLRRMDQMPEPQRDRRLARNEMLERLSPNERQGIVRSGRQWATLPPDRQMMMRRAFNDLRGVPLDQRQMVLNSARYQGAFSPEERGILSDFLRVEPYEPVR